MVDGHEEELRKDVPHGGHHLLAQPLGQRAGHVLALEDEVEFVAQGEGHYLVAEKKKRFSV